MYRRSFIEELVWFTVGAIALGACVAPARSAEFTLTVYTSSSCPPCEKWKSEALPTLKSIKELEIKQHRTATIPTPTFTLTRGEKSSTWQGYSNWTNHRKHLVDAIAKVLGVPVSEVQTCCRPGQRMRPAFATPVRSFLWAMFRPVAYVPQPPRPQLRYRWQLMPYWSME